MEYVIIMGASIDNLGAESMTCIAIEMSRKLYPNAQIVLASTDNRGAQKELKFPMRSYILPTNLEKKYNSFTSVLLRRYLNVIDDLFYVGIMQKTKMIIDVSGYIFTTKFGLNSMAVFLNNIYVAKKYNIPYFVMQQSFGPISIEHLMDRLVFKILMCNILRYPKKLLAREIDGYKLIKKYSKRNSGYKPDMVLLYDKDIDYTVLRKLKYEKSISIEEKSVAIIPNQKIIEKTNMGEVYIEILEKTIVLLKQKGFNICIICHCGLDREICTEVYSRVHDDAKMLDCTEWGGAMFSDVIKEFSFAIASRYHSVVHMYRYGIPSIVLGWEEKYNELARIMNQYEFICDCRYEFDKESYYDKLTRMISSYDLNKEIIKNRIMELRDEYKQCEIDL